MSGPRRAAGKWLGLAALVLAGLLLVRLNRPSAPDVTAAQVTAGPFESWVTTNGAVEPIDPSLIRARLATFVAETIVRAGQAVARGDLVLRLDAAGPRADLARMRGELLKAQDDLRTAEAGGRPDEIAQLDADLRSADADLGRLRREGQALERLVAKQAATRDELDRNRAALVQAEAKRSALEQKKIELARQARREVEQARLAVERARREVSALEVQVRSAEVRAPVTGTLYSLPVRPGAYVDVGSVLAGIADLRRVQVRAFVDEAELGSVEPGELVQVSWDALPHRTWTGRTEQVPKEVVRRGDRSVGEVVCSVDNRDQQLLVNINVDVRIRVAARNQALVVPRAAVRGDGARRYVFVVRGNRLEEQPIRLGMGSPTSYEVLGGLTQGEWVVLRGDETLREGMAVRVAGKR